MALFLNKCMAEISYLCIAFLNIWLQWRALWCMLLGWANIMAKLFCMVGSDLLSAVKTSSCERLHVQYTRFNVTIWQCKTLLNLLWCKGNYLYAHFLIIDKQQATEKYCFLYNKLHLKNVKTNKLSNITMNNNECEEKEGRVFPTFKHHLKVSSQIYLNNYTACFFFKLSIGTNSIYHWFFRKISITLILLTFKRI